jgi:hypothetical protein
MQPLTVVCNARKPGGTWCGETAVVHQARYEFDTDLYGSPGGIQHRVTKAVYEIECPKCGRRTQIEKAERSQPQG